MLLGEAKWPFFNEGSVNPVQLNPLQVTVFRKEWPITGHTIVRALCSSLFSNLQVTKQLHESSSYYLIMVL